MPDNRSLGHNCRPITSACKLRTGPCLKAIPFPIPFPLTAADCRSSFSSTWGAPVKCLRWMIAIAGTCLLTICSTTVQTDDPETPYNESEAPFNLIAIVSVDTVVRPLTTCLDRPITVVRLHQDGAIIQTMSGMSATCPSHLRLKLLSKALLC